MSAKAPPAICSYGAGTPLAAARGMANYPINDNETERALRAYAAERDQSITHVLNCLLRGALGLAAPQATPKPGRPAKRVELWEDILHALPSPFTEAELISVLGVSRRHLLREVVHQWAKRLWISKHADGLWHKSIRFPAAPAE